MVGNTVDDSDRTVGVEDDLPQGDVPQRQLSPRARQQAVLGAQCNAWRQRCLQCTAALRDCDGRLLGQARAAGRLTRCEPTQCSLRTLHCA